ATYGKHPSGDAPLWAPGALPLLGLLAREAAAVRAALGTAGAVLAASAVAGLVPLAALMAAMAYRSDGGRSIGGARAVYVALASFKRFAFLLVAVGLGQ